MSQLSIVTICYNSEAHLEQTIRSVVGQSYPDIEYIVVDGGSTDGTLDIIRKYEARIDRWVSEPDDGIADAMNKAIDLASGEFVYFLHSDDFLENDSSIADACRHLDDDHDIFLFSIYLEKDGNKTLHQPRGLNWWINMKTGVFHQAAFCRKSLFDRIGRFDGGFRIGMDYDFFLRAYKKGVAALRVDIPISTMRLTGISSRTDWPALLERFGEERAIQNKNDNTLWMRCVYAIWWSLYLPYRRVRFALAGSGH